MREPIADTAVVYAAEKRQDDPSLLVDDWLVRKTGASRAAVGEAIERAVSRGYVTADGTTPTPAGLAMLRDATGGSVVTVGKLGVR